MELKGMAHIVLTVGSFERSLPFYKGLLGEMGLAEMIVTNDYYYCVGRRLCVGIRGYEGAPGRFEQENTGLHHCCFGLGSRSDVDRFAAVVGVLGGTVVRAPAAQDHWFPGMYSTLVEDPDGIRLEANHITPAS